MVASRQDALPLDVIITDGTRGLILIPKVASTSLREALEWKETNQTDGLDLFAFIRDPVDRWFSGITERFGSVSPLIVGLAKGGCFEWDGYTRAQSTYLTECETVRLEHAGAYLGIALPRRNQSSWEPIPELVPLIREAYADDLRLYEEAK